MKQTTMFANGEDLPLFSGTPQTVTLPPPPPETQRRSRQITFAKCPICLDTGLTSVSYCWCEAGESLRLEHRQKGISL